MTDSLTQRLNEILPKVISTEFLSGKGLGNEIAFYIFDYPPEAELRIREHIQFLMAHIPKNWPGFRVMHVNLFDLIVDHLKDRNLLEKSFRMQRDKGDKALHKALLGPLKSEKLVRIFVEVAQPEEQDLVLVSGVGSVWPLVRSHNLLNNLQTVMGQTPLVMFYPGRYDGQALRLFGKIKSNNYYRAFKLVP
ncbi:MAG: DUF1788 domain-containing protein [Deltaproteobacteria bacterium]|nr:DUF1788 domain-containing protein [Deltaproteobacteria bacterium]